MASLGTEMILLDGPMNFGPLPLVAHVPEPEPDMALKINRLAPIVVNDHGFDMSLFFQHDVC